MNITIIILTFVAIALLMVAVLVLDKRNRKQVCESEGLRLKVAKLESDLEYARKEVVQTRENAEQRISEALAHRDKEEAVAKQEREAYNQKQLELLEEKFKTTSAELLKQRQEELKVANHDEVGKIVNPIEEQLKEVRAMLEKAKEGQATSMSKLEGQFATLVGQTQQLGRDANNLAEALKNKGKVHGDFSEMVLAEILTNSGLKEGLHFFRQDSYKGASGNELRPDVVVNCPGRDGEVGRIIVDSKCSLTAWADYVGATNEDERKDAEKRNLQSVKQHIKELAEKDYPKYVPNSMKYNLMFIPNEGAYILALNSAPNLNQEAFNQGVILVNPTTLMMVLFLVWQSWQGTRQEDNCRAIIEMATDMYDKMMGVVDTCATLGNQLDTAERTYQRAMNQLSDGKGNLLARVEKLKDMGVTSTKKVKTKRAKQLDFEINEIDGSDVAENV